MDASSTGAQVKTTARDMRVTHVFNPCSLLTCTCARQGYIEASEFGSVVARVAVGTEVR